jgi:hypothetical protein
MVIDNLPPAIFRVLANMHFEPKVGHFMTANENQKVQ